ncbi:MAG: NrsF family protein, partial [Pseudomonadota bacterium]
LLGVSCVLLVGVIAELFVLPSDVWLGQMVGSNASWCLRIIPLLAAAPLVACFLALRRAAPTRPALAGAAAGLLSAAVAASLYALHCTDDSPLFVAAWYGLAILLVTAVGAALGPRLLRW